MFKGNVFQILGPIDFNNALCVIEVFNLDTGKVVVGVTSKFSTMGYDNNILKIFWSQVMGAFVHKHSYFENYIFTYK